MREKVLLEDQELAQAPKWVVGGAWQNRKVIAYAKKLYFKDYRYSSIFLATNLPYETFQKCVYKRLKGQPVGWMAQRTKYQDEVFKSCVLEGKTLEGLLRITNMSIAVLQRYCYRMVTREEEITTKDAKLLSDILANIHRLKQLEQGKPTDITEQQYRTMSSSEMKEEAIRLFQEMQTEDDIVDYLPEKLN